MNTAPSAIEQLKQAFHADDAGRVRTLLDDHPQLKARINDPVGPFDSPAITCARSRAMLDVLLDAGADLNAKSNWWAGGFGLLHTADPGLAAYAIERGAVVDVHAAARLGLLDRVKELIAADPGLVHARGGDGQTPLHFASNVEIAACLLDHGADPEARDVDHASTPAQYHIVDRQQVVRYLIQRGCKTDLLMAAALGDEKLIRSHLDKDPSCIRLRVSDEYFPMSGGKTGGTTYQWTLGWYVSAHQVARKFGHEACLQLLMERSPPPVKLIAACWLQDDDTIQAVRTSHPDVVREFIAEDLRQPAHAARNNDLGALQRFLACGLPVDGKSQHQATPLHWAAFHGNAEMVKLLLPFGPPLEMKDADHCATPIGWVIHGSEHGWNAQGGDFAGAVDALLEAGAKCAPTAGGSKAVQAVLRRRGLSTLP